MTERQPPVVVFRADASSVIGSGHIMRCLTLAEELDRWGWSCAFAVKAETLDAVPKIRQYKNDVFVLSGDSDDECSAAMNAHWPGGCDWLVVDHYGLDEGFEKGCRNWARKIAVIDDLADRRHDCDLLIDFSLEHGHGAYAGLVPASAKMCTGPGFALLRPQFLHARKSALARRDGALKRVLVSLGGNTPQQLIRKIVDDIVSMHPDLEIDVVGGFSVLDAPQASGRVTWHAAVDDMAALMARADVSVGAGGGTAWERCCLGLPTLMIVLADNQRGNAVSLSDAGAVVVVQDDDAARTLGRMPDLKTMARRAAALCDGRGVERVALSMLEPGVAKDGGEVALRLAEWDDGDSMLEWQSQPETRRFARIPEAPRREDHEAWLRATLDDPERHLYVILHRGERAGIVRLDRIPHPSEPERYEVSIYIAPKKYRLGLASLALDMVGRLRPRAMIRAYVKAENAASRSLFLGAGYVDEGDDWYVRRPTVK